MSEAEIMRAVQLRASECGVRLWRNNVGLLTNDAGDKIRVGLCRGSSDLIGCYRGRFTAVEIKRPGQKPTTEQLAFINMVVQDGGIAFWCDSVERFDAELQRFKLSAPSNS